VLALIASLGGPQELSLVLDRVTDGAARPIPDRLRLLEALEQATRQRNVRPAGDLARIVPLLKEENESLCAVVARLAGLWNLEAARGSLLALARDDKIRDGLRKAALEGLAALGGQATRDALQRLAEMNGSAARRRMALVALVAVDAKAAAARAFGVLSSLPSSDEAIPIFEAFLERKGGATVLAGALRAQKLPGDVAKVGVRTVRTSGRPDGGLVEALTQAGGLTAGARVLSPQDLQTLVADVSRLGNPARGEALFRRKDQECLKCHAVGGAGGQVGPDLSSIGASAPVDYLIESVLVPNKAVKENYHSLLVSTKKGQQYAGIKVRETKTELILRNAEDAEIAIPIKDIDEQSPGGSLMPEGLTDTLTRGELIDLVRFLSELGKVGPYSIGPRRVVRRWQALEPTREAWGFLILGGGLSAPAKDVPGLQWGPLYSTVAGELPLADAPLFHLGQEKHKVLLVRCQVDVTTAGPFVVRFNATKGLSLWVDQNPTAIKDALELNLPVGLYTLTFVVDRDIRQEGLKCELDDKPGSPARVRAVGGK
jgi:putative heme-binding domain-containing protein